MGADFFEFVFAASFASLISGTSAVLDLPAVLSLHHYQLFNRRYEPLSEPATIKTLSADLNFFIR